MNRVTITGPVRARWSPVTDNHPWAAAWTVLSPQRRAALHSRIVDREPVATLATRLGRTEENARALIASTLVAFRREVVLGIGTGYAEECGAVVLRLVDTAGEALTKADRRALAAHAETCPDCARAVGELLELDAGLRDGLVELVGTDVPVALAPGDAWASAFAKLTAERRTALVHGAAGAEPAPELAARLGTTEPAARQLAASSVVAFRQTVLRGLPVGSGAGCALVAEHRTDDVVLDGARSRALKAHAAACTDCAPTVAEILALQGSLRPRVAGLALGAESDAWLEAAPRRSWVPGVERPAEPLDRRRRLGIGAGLTAAAVAAIAVLGGGQPDRVPTDVAAADAPVVDVTTDGDTSTDGDGDQGAEQVVVAGSRFTARTPVAIDAATAAPQPAPAGGPRPTGGTPGTIVIIGGGPGKDPGGPGTPDPEPTPPLDVQVDGDTGSVTVTVGLLGDPIVITTPPITVVNKR